MGWKILYFSGGKGESFILVLLFSQVQWPTNLAFFSYNIYSELLRCNLFRLRCIFNKNGLTAKETFSESEMISSSTWREFQLLLHVFHFLIGLIEGKVVKHRMDCQNVVRILNSGSKKFDLQIFVCNIFKLCIKHNIQLHSE